MKPATLLYFSTIEYLREEARLHGYAIAVHGSMARDLDLIAAPWTEQVSSAADLAQAIRRKLELCTGEKWYMRDDDPGHKPHGRLAWSLHPGCGSGGSFIDLSVMPPKPAETADQPSVAASQAEPEKA